MLTESIKLYVINILSAGDMRISFYLDLFIYIYTHVPVFISIYSVCHIFHSLKFHVRKLLLETCPYIQESAVEVLHYILPMSQS